MPHDKSRAAGGVALDRRRALTITAVGKLDNCRSGDPFKIPKPRVSGEDESAEADVARCTRTYPKIHWSQLASNGVSSQPVHHNGSQTLDPDKQGVEKLDITRQVKVILTDVLQTEEGQRYLSSCGHEFKKKCQPEPKREARERRKERRVSPELGEGTRGSPQKNVLSSKETESASTENSDASPSKETKSPLPKRPRRFSNSLKQTKPTSSNEKELHPQIEHIHIAMLKQIKSKSADVDKDELCPVEECESAKSSASLLHSERTNLLDDEQSNLMQISELTTAQGCTSSLSRQRHRMEQSTRKMHSNQYNIRETKMQESAEDVGKDVQQNNQEKEEATEEQRRGEVLEEGGGSRQSVLRLSLGAVGDQMEMGLAAGEIPPSCCVTQSADLKLRKVFKLHTPEPIVLSSEEEEEMEGSSTSHLQALDGVKDPQRLGLIVERKKTTDLFTYTSEIHNQASSFVDCALSGSPVMELQFSALYMGGLSALSNGPVKITHDRITISLKDPSGTEVNTSLATAHVRKYSVWDGAMVQDSGLVKQDETPPPSLLLLWLSEGQAQHLSSDLSIIQPGIHPAEGSVCVLLCVSEALKGIEGALLASIMDIVGLRHGTTELLSPLSHTESMKLLQCGRDTHLLQLLSPRTGTHSFSNESITTVPAGTTTTPVTDSEVQTSAVYTLCHNSAQGSYSVSMVSKPGPEWTPYRHRGPTRRLIQFPPPPCKRAITVTTEDLECLDSGEFLNDVIIDFYLKYLLVQKAPHASVKRSHVFSSFFYKQLTRRDNANEDSSSTPAQLRRHQRVRTWTRHVDIFEKDFLFVPVNQEAHWYLVVVCFPGMDEPVWIERENQDSLQNMTENSIDSTASSETHEVSRHNMDGDTITDENSSKSISTPGPPNCTEKTCTRKTVCKSCLFMSASSSSYASTCR
ncbi:uncharacterized protein [Salminus brasiliensis]|uniref:uncharacterized protein isoform X2 n=1 Tax=Salminus brasiliensis TaxID=930266 RepID=UPI003B838DEB